MAKIIIDGTPYDLADNLTFRENKLSKRVAGISVWEFGDAWDTDRASLALAHAVIAYHRENPHLSDAQLEQLFLDRPIEKIIFDFSEDEAEKPVPTGADKVGDSEKTLSESSTTETLEEAGAQP